MNGRRLREVLVALATIAGLQTAPHAATAGVGEPQFAWVPSLPLRQQGQTFLSLFPNGAGFVFHSEADDNGFLWATSDFGATYQPRLSPPFRSTGSVRFGNPQLGFGVGFGGEIFRTEDGGQTWIELTGWAPGSVLNTTDAFDVADEGRTVAALASVEGRVGDVCEDPNDDLISLFVSRDRGETWNQGSLPWGNSGFKVAMLDSRHGIVIVSELAYTRTGECGWSGSGSLGERVYVTHNGGRSFKRVMECLPDTCLAVGIASPKHFAVGRIQGTVSVTSDGGKTFRDSHLAAITEPPSQADYLYWVMGVEFADESIVYVSTNGRGMWRSTDGGLNWVKEPSPHQAFLGLGIGDLAVADSDHALAGGPALVVRRLSPS